MRGCVPAHARYGAPQLAAEYGARVTGRVLVFAVAVALLVPDIASAADRVQGTVSLFSEPAEFGPKRDPRVFDTARGDAITAYITGDGWTSFSVNFDGPDSVSLRFATPDRKPMRRGIYTRAERIAGAGRSELSVLSGVAACDPVAGRFEVRSWSVDASGRLRRAWVLFEQSCEDVPPVFGELRIGYPRAAVAPSVVRWPALDVGRAGVAVPVRVRRGQIARAAVVGPAASDFAILPDACGGCEAWVRFVPTATGVRAAWLRLTTTSGARVDVPLQGFAYGGVTTLDLHTEPSDPIGPGVARHYDLTSRWTVWTFEREAHAVVYRASDDVRTLHFWVPRGQVLAPGNFTVPPDSPTIGAPSMSVCSAAKEGWFTVHELTSAEAYDGRSPTLSMSFAQNCGPDIGWVRGTLNFRAGDTTAPAPWMIERIAPADPNAALRTAIAIENRHHAAAARAFKARVKRLRPALITVIGDGIDGLRSAIERYQRILLAATPTTERLNATRRSWLRRLERETRLLAAFVNALNHGFDRASKRARDRVLRELARAP